MQRYRELAMNTSQSNLQFTFVFEMKINFPFWKIDEIFQQ